MEDKRLSGGEAMAYLSTHTMVVSKKPIADDSKLLAEFLGWKYIASNSLGSFPRAGWYKKTITSHNSILLEMRKKRGETIIGNESFEYMCRSHNDLRFYNSYEWLMWVVEKLETIEGLSIWIHKSNIFISYQPLRIDKNINPKTQENKTIGKKEKLFLSLVEAIENLNKLK